MLNKLSSLQSIYLVDGDRRHYLIEAAPVREVTEYLRKSLDELGNLIDGPMPHGSIDAYNLSILDWAEKFYEEMTHVD